MVFFILRKTIRAQPARGDVRLRPESVMYDFLTGYGLKVLFLLFLVVPDGAAAGEHIFGIDRLFYVVMTTPLNDISHSLWYSSSTILRSNI